MRLVGLLSWVALMTALLLAYEFKDSSLQFKVIFLLSTIGLPLGSFLAINRANLKNLIITHSLVTKEIPEVLIDDDDDDDDDDDELEVVGKFVI